MELKNYGGLEYVTVRVSPDGHDDVYGPTVSAKLWGRVEQLVAKGILELGYPIRGKELKFLRKTSGLTMRALAEELHVSHPTVIALEKSEERLEPVYETFFRVFFAEKLGLKRTSPADFLPKESGKVKPLKIVA
jgi:DNA-binding XRE family transcriptional regulator